jgi:metal-responsive CopG/Arc/MetJ family transcriptional regulator
MDDLQYNENGRARVSLELGRDVIEAIDKLRVEWDLRSRGAIVERLLQELLIGDEKKE